MDRVPIHTELRLIRSEIIKIMTNMCIKHNFSPQIKYIENPHLIFTLLQVGQVCQEFLWLWYDSITIITAAIWDLAKTNHFWDPESDCADSVERVYRVATQYPFQNSLTFH